VVEKKEYQKYNFLLQRGEYDLPIGVKKTIDFFEENGLWFQLSRNFEARSCRDAAYKRNRLGHMGIPLHDELKSFMGTYKNESGENQIVMFHCRGNQELDMDKVKLALKTKFDVTRLSGEEMQAEFGLEYGIVNPFTIYTTFHSNSVVQVFDTTIFENILPPYTMMTNSGDLTWAVEFNPGELFKSMRESIAADIIDIENSEPLPVIKHKIGIITGNAPDSGIHLWQEINKFIREAMGEKFQGDISYPPVLVESIPEMGLSMELDKRYAATEKSILKTVTMMIEEGATIICLACNTTQYFGPLIKEICDHKGVSFISIPEVTLDYIKRNGIKDFAFLGIKYVTDFEKWSAFKELKNYQVEFLDELTLKKIDDLAYIVKQGGTTEKGTNKLRDLLNQTVKSDIVIIALTELSILFKTRTKKSNSDRVYIDTLDLLARAISNIYLKDTYPSFK